MTLLIPPQQKVWQQFRLTLTCPKESEHDTQLNKWFIERQTVTWRDADTSKERPMKIMSREIIYPSCDVKDTLVEV